MSSHHMLITPTLLNAFRWYLQPYGDEPEDETIQREDFLRVLRRQSIEEYLVSEAIIRGRDLETDVHLFSKQAILPETLPRDIKYLAELCRGGYWQQPVKRVLDHKFLLYGRADRIFEDTIDDVKFCRNYDIGKFVKSAQHPLYLWCADSQKKFRYLISDGRDAYVESYTYRTDTEQHLRSLIHDFTNYLRDDPEARELFETNWRAL